MKLSSWFILCCCFLGFEAGFAKSHHQIGEHWGKTPLFASVEGLASNHFFSSRPEAQRVAKATAWLTQPVHNQLGNYLGSAHLLGMFDGKYVMMTNSHLVHEKLCSGITIRFVFLEGQPLVKCNKVFYRNEKIDLALMFVEPPAGLEKQFESLGVNLAFGSELRKGDSLYSIGFSRHEGIRNIKPGEPPKTPQLAYLTRDRDCRVLSNQERLIRNPKKGTEVFKPTHVHSFANGCDAFDAGDCGAVYVNESSNKIVGIYWGEGFYEPGVQKDVDGTPLRYVTSDKTGGLQLSDEPQAATLDIVPSPLVNDKQPEEEFWNTFTYGVSAKTIKREILKDPIVDEPDYQCLFQQIFSNHNNRCD